jgi:hypothetical protein
MDDMNGRDLLLYQEDRTINLIGLTKEGRGLYRFLVASALEVSVIKSTPAEGVPTSHARVFPSSQSWCLLRGERTMVNDHLVRQRVSAQASGNFGGIQALQHVHLCLLVSAMFEPRETLHSHSLTWLR